MFNTLLTKFNKSHLAHKYSTLFRTFTFRGKHYHYYTNQYNTTHRNERTVEVPIIWEEVQKFTSGQVLEIGNVLAHYYPVKHKVVDKYEKAKGVVNADIATFKTKKKYKLIVSISTLEHVGWDEKPKSKTKILKAFKNVKSMLAPGGVAWITVPLGYNKYLDELINTGKIVADDSYFLQRISEFNSWHEVTKKIVKKHPKYDAPFQNANVIVIYCLINKSSKEN